MAKYKEPVLCKNCKHKQVGPDRTKPGYDWHCAKLGRDVNSNGSCKKGKAY